MDEKHEKDKVHFLARLPRQLGLEDEDTNREQEVDTRGRAVDDPEDEPAHANQEEELLLLHPREGDEGEEDESAPEI